MFHESYDITNLVPASYNPRKITKESSLELEESIRALGVVKPIIATVDNIIVAGHQRVSALIRMNETTAPVYLLPTINVYDEIRFNQLHNGTDLDSGDERASVPPRVVVEACRSCEACGDVNNSTSMIEACEACRGIKSCEACEACEACSTYSTFVDIEAKDIVCNMRGGSQSVKAAMMQLMIKFGGWGGAVACADTGRIISGGTYAICCKQLRIPLRVCYIPYEACEACEACGYFSKTYGNFSYQHLQKTPYHQTYAQPYRFRKRKDDGSYYDSPSYLYGKVIIPKLKRSDRLLDFGCGQADTVKLLKRKGYSNVWGVEFFYRTGNKINKRLVHKMIDDVCDELNKNGLFDIVICDFVVNTADSLQAAQDILTVTNALCKPGGLICVSGRHREFVDERLNTKIKSDRKIDVMFLDENDFTAQYLKGGWLFQHFQNKINAEKLGRSLIGNNNNDSYQFYTDYKYWYLSGIKSTEFPKNPRIVEESLRREFDLPWPNGTSVNRADEIIAAWHQAKSTSKKVL